MRHFGRGFWTLVWREIYRFTSVFLQTLMPPLVSSFLFIFIFGFALGRSLNEIAGLPYLTFLIPGLIMMYLIEGSYANSSSSLFVARWNNHIQEILVTPLSYIEMVLAFLIGSMVRALIVGFGVYLISLIFTQFPAHNVFLILFFSIFVSLTFASVGLLVGLLSDEWEQMSLLTTFLIQPLTYFGGVFHSLDMLPSALKFISYLNPIYYMVSGLRYAMIGMASAPIAICVSVVLIFFLILFGICVTLFKSGYKLRN